MQGCNSYKQESPSHFNAMSLAQAPVGLAHRNTHRNECTSYGFVFGKSFFYIYIYIVTVPLF